MITKESTPNLVSDLLVDLGRPMVSDVVEYLVRLPAMAVLLHKAKVVIQKHTAAVLANGSVVPWQSATEEYVVDGARAEGMKPSRLVDYVSRLERAAMKRLIRKLERAFWDTPGADDPSGWRVLVLTGAWMNRTATEKAGSLKVFIDCVYRFDRAP